MSQPANLQNLQPPPAVISGPPLLAAAILRANPAYGLVAFDRLSPEQQGTFQGLEADPEHFGLLRPEDPGSGLSYRAVDRATALLLYVLREPGTLPRRLVPRDAVPGGPMGADEARLEESLAGLVLSGVLEVEVAGAFVHGPEALQAVLRPAEASRGAGAEPDGESSEAALPRVAQLSRQALRWAQELAVTDPMALSQALYQYHRVPRSPRWERRLPDRRAVRQLLGLGKSSRGLGEETELEALLARRWRSEDAESDESPWLSWAPKASSSLRLGLGGGPGAPAPRTDEPAAERAPGEPAAEDFQAGTFKLYVSPRLEALPEAFRAVVEVLDQVGPVPFKVGASLADLLRPDKLVLYFPGAAALEAAARALAERLDGCPAHGVPFTAPLDGDGLLSWGVDPVRNERTVSWLQRESWRLRVARRLGSALAGALASKPAPGTAPEPWRFALERVRFEGIDPERWTPRGLGEAVSLPDPRSPARGARSA